VGVGREAVVLYFLSRREGGTDRRAGRKAKKKGLEELETQIRALKVGEGGMEGGEKYVVWATALVIIYLEKEWGEYEEEWEAAAKKAKRWLLRSVGGSEEQVEEVMGKARKVLALVVVVL